MNRLANDLFLLMMNLSRLRDRELILRTFVEALRASRPGIEVTFSTEAPPASPDTTAVATADHAFGFVTFGGSGPSLPPDDRATLRNAVVMLAVLLENRIRAERLESENARLDAAVAERTRTLENAQKELQFLYDNAPCGIHALSPDGRWLMANATELRWLGYERSELVGAPFVSFLPEADQPKFPQYLALLAEQGTLKNLEFSLRRKDGSFLPVALNAAATYDEAGRFSMSRSTLVDLTERKQAEARVREAEHRARQAQKLEAVGRLAGGVAHDFNNLLTVILSGVASLEEGIGLSDPRARELSEIREAAQRAAGLTRQLLTFSRRQTTLPSRVDLSQVVDNLRMLKRLIGEDIDLRTELERPMPPVLIDVGQLEQVIVNLVVNARDALHQGGRITIVTRRLSPTEGGALQLPGSGQWAVLSVEDTGTGMDEATQARLFEPFFTTKEAGRGTGLGLATAYGIVRQAGGEIRVESRPGAGSRFSVYLPRAEGEVDVTPPTAVEALPRGRGTILLVEDEPLVRAHAARALRSAGYTVLEAGDGAEALERMRVLDGVGLGEAPLELLVTDVVMPNMSGEVLAQRLRAKRPSLPVVFVSGYPDRDAPFSGPGDERQVFLSKPFTPAVLAAAVQRLLDAGLRRG